MAVNKSLYGDALPFDPEKDIQPIALIERGAMVLGVGSKSPYATVAALVADGKAKPDQLNYAPTGEDGASHLVSALFQDSAGFNSVHIQDRQPDVQGTAVS